MVTKSIKFKYADVKIYFWVSLCGSHIWLKIGLVLFSRGKSQAGRTWQLGSTSQCFILKFGSISKVPRQHTEGRMAAIVITWQYFAIFDSEEPLGSFINEYVLGDFILK